MGFVSRFLLFIYTLFFALMALGIIVLTTGLVPSGEIFSVISYWLGRMETVAIAAVIFLISIELMASGCFSKSDGSAKGGALVHGEKGDVSISSAAILETVERLARSMSGVYTVKARARFRHGKESCKVLLHLDLGIAPQGNAVQIANQLQNDIKEYLSSYMGIDDLEIGINIDGIRQIERKKRVV